MGEALATYDSTSGDMLHGREHSEAHTIHRPHTVKEWLGPWYVMTLDGDNFTLKIRRNPRKVSMQHQHSCGTLESRIKILGCMVQELQIIFYSLDHSPLLHPGCVHIKGV